MKTIGQVETIVLGRAGLLLLTSPPIPSCTSPSIHVETYGGSCSEYDKWMSITLPSFYLWKFIRQHTPPPGARAGWEEAPYTRSNRFSIMNTNQYWFSCMFCWLLVVRRKKCAVDVSGGEGMDLEWMKCLFSEWCRFTHRQKPQLQLPLDSSKRISSPLTSLSPLSTASVRSSVVWPAFNRSETAN